MPHKLSNRMLVLTNQLGQVALDVQKIVVQPESVAHIHLDEQEQQMTNDYMDLLTQVYVLGKELNLVKNETDLGILLVRGEGRMERRRQEYQAKGWNWI